MHVFTGLIYDARICRRFHCTTEIYETWVAESSAPTLAGDSRLESPMVSRVSGLGNDGMFCGPVEFMAAAAVRQNDRITYAPVVNEICTGSWAEDSTWTREDPDNAGVEMHMEFMRRRPIPAGYNRARVRVHVQQNAASAEDLTIRAYCGNLPGSFIGNNPVGYEVYSAAVTRNADDTTGPTRGAWVTVAESLRIPESNTDYRCFWLGFAPGSVTDYRIRAWTVELFEDQDPDGFGSGGGFGG